MGQGMGHGNGGIVLECVVLGLHGRLAGAGVGVGKAPRSCHAKTALLGQHS